MRERARRLAVVYGASRLSDDETDTCEPHADSQAGGVLVCVLRGKDQVMAAPVASARLASLLADDIYITGRHGGR